MFEDIEVLAAQHDLNAIYIASTHQFHAAHTRVAAAHGKHVLIEKPMAITLPECDDMIQACSRLACTSSSATATASTCPTSLLEKLWRPESSDACV